MGIFKVGQFGVELQYAPVKDTLAARLVAIATYYAITVATIIIANATEGVIHTNSLSSLTSILVGIHIYIYI